MKSSHVVGAKSAEDAARRANQALFDLTTELLRLAVVDANSVVRKRLIGHAAQFAEMQRTVEAWIGTQP